MKNVRRVIGTVYQKVREMGPDGTERVRTEKVDFYSATEYRQHLQQAAMRTVKGMGSQPRFRGVVLAQTARNAEAMAKHDNIIDGAEFRAAFGRAKETQPKARERRQARKWVRGVGISRIAHEQLRAERELTEQTAAA